MEKALLIAVNNGLNIDEFNEEILELKSLCEACSIEIVEVITQNLNSFHPETYIGKGKVQEVKDLLDDELFVVTNDELSPLQISNLEKELHTEVYDRTYIILEIFRSRAKTKEAQLQVELATQKYLLPRLIGAYPGVSPDKEEQAVVLAMVAEVVK